MRLPVVFQPEAKNQILAAFRWWAEHRSDEQADRWYVEIMRAIETLGETADRYPLARENEHFNFDLKVMNFGVSGRPTHRVLFTTTSENVEVLSVRHVAQADVTPDDL